jgi:hypothetical protein
MYEQPRSEAKNSAERQKANKSFLSIANCVFCHRTAPLGDEINENQINCNLGCREMTKAVKSAHLLSSGIESSFPL